MKNRILLLSLVFVMLLAVAPAAAAADTVTITVKENDHVLITETGYKQFTHNTADSQKPETPYVGPYVITTEDPDVEIPCHIYIFAAEVGQSNNAAVTLRNVNLTGIDEDASTPLAIAGGTGAGNQTTATIKLEGDNKLKGWSGGAGLTVERNSSYAPEAIIEGPGSLTAIGGDNAAGIGCGAGKAGMGTITINSGTVHAIGGTGAAGIGRGNRLVEGWATSTYDGTININGGTVYAQGTADETNPGDASTPCGAAGIGLGYCEADFASKYIIDKININGGTVTAAGVGYSACIGGTYGTNVTITGGTVTAAGENIASDCAEIGKYTGNYGAFEFCEKTSGYPGKAIICVSGPNKITTTSTSNPYQYWTCIVYEGSNGTIYTATYKYDCTLEFTEADNFSIPDGKTLEIPSGKVLKLPKGSAGLLSGNVTGEGSVEMDGIKYYIDSEAKTIKPYEVEAGLYYKTLDEAFANGNYTKNLLTDVSYDKVFTFSDELGFLFNLNGHTVNLNSSGQFNTELKANIYDYASDRFKLQDTSAEKTGKMTGNSANAIVLSPDGKLVIEGGTYENAGSGPAVQFSGTVKGNNLKGGTFSKIEYTGNPLVGALAAGYGFQQTGENGETWWIAADSGQSVLEDVTVAQITGTLPAITPALTVSADSVAVTEVAGGTYQWYEGGAAISGAAGSTLPLSEVAIGNHTVTCHVTAGGVTVASDPVQITGTKPTEPVRITITGDPSKTYDGAAAVLGANGYTVTPAGVTAKVEYAVKDSGSFSSAAPVNAGSYTVRVTAGGETAVKEFTISQAKPNVGDVSCSTAIHLSTAPAAVTLTHSGTTGGTVTLAGNTVFTLGTKNYDWIFTPADAVNYTTDTGTITLTVSANGSSSDSGGSSSDNDSSSSGSTSTRNPDGSTTTKTENRGTVTETTRNPDGSQTVVETRADGTVTTTGRAADGSAATVTTDASGKTEATVDLSARALSNAAGGTISLPMAEVSATRSAETAPVITVNTGSSDPVKVEIPTSNVTPGTVAVIVKADGTEEIVKSSVATEKGVAVSLSDGATVKIVENSKTFEDVSRDNWAADAVSFASARELFSGTSETTFTPDAPVTRAMLMTVLARYDGEDTAGGATWYEKGMDWAASNSVSDGSNPDGNVSREQLAVMLWHYAGSPAPGGSLARFSDAGSVSGYAQDAMRWAVENGIINGFGDGQLGPQGQATRAQVAQVLKNFIEQ